MSAGFRAGTSNDGYIQTGGVDQIKIDSTGNIIVPNGTLMVPKGVAMSTPFSYRNRIINGDLRVQQRVSGVYNNGNGNFYSGPDRFTTQCATTTGQFTQSAQTMTINGTAYASLRQTVNTVASAITAGNYWQGMQQPVEGYNCYDLVNQSFTISFWFNSNVAGTYNLSVRDSGAVHSYVTTLSFTTANVPQYVTITVPAYASMVSPNSNGAGLYVTIGGLNSGTYATSTLNVWQSGNYFVNGSTTNWAATIGNFIEVTMLQLEAGTVATPFEFLRYQDQLLQCQRYFQTWGAGGNVFMAAGGMQAATLAYVSVATACAMRASPTMGSTGTITIYGNSSVLNVTAFSYVYWGKDSPNFGLGLTTSTGVTAQPVTLYTNGATVSASAEL